MDYVVELSARTGFHLNFMAGNLYWFNIGALTIRIGFGLLDSILIIRNPKIILVMIIQASIVQNFLAKRAFWIRSAKRTILVYFTEKGSLCERAHKPYGKHLRLDTTTWRIMGLSKSGFKYVNWAYLYS